MPGCIASERSSVVLLLMKIIQFVAVNVHDKTQHIVDQCRKPCTLIPQQVKDFRYFVLGLGARTVVILHMRKIRSRKPLWRFFKVFTKILRRSLCEAVAAPKSRSFF